MNWLDAVPAALKDSFFLVGLVCVVVGLLVRGIGGNGRGLGMSVVVVGVCLLVLPPLGRILGWW